MVVSITSILEATEGVRTEYMLHKNLILKNCHYLTSSISLMKAPLSVLVFIWPDSRSLLCGNSPSPRHLWQINDQGSLLCIQADRVGASKRLAKILKGNTEKWNVIFLWHIPGNPEGHSYMKGCMHAQERHKKALISHFWLTLMLCSSKWRLTQSCKLPVRPLNNIPQNIYATLWQRLRELLVQRI